MSTPALKTNAPTAFVAENSGPGQESNLSNASKNPVLKAGNNAASEAIGEMRKDIDVIIREIQAAFPNRTLIVSLVSKWQGRDRALSAGIGTPFLDRFFSILEGTQIEKRTWKTVWAAVTVNALDSLVHSLESSVVFRQQFKSSNAYKNYYVKPEVSAIWEWEVMLAKELNEYVERGDYEKVVGKLKEVNTTDRDDVSVALVSHMSDKSLLAVAKSKEGSDLLTRLYDELSSGNYGEDERYQAGRIFNTKNSVYAANTPLLEEEFTNSNIKIFPHRKTGITVGIFGAPAANVSAFRSRAGYIKVRMPMSVYTSPTYKREAESLGIEVFSGGIEIPENEIVRVVDYDDDGKEIDRPAYYLLELSNEDTSHTFQKIGEVAGYALMFGPGAAAEGGVQAVTFAARAVRFLKYADNVAMGIGVFTSILSEHRGWIIREFESGREFVESVERINSVIMIYGFFRMATQMPWMAKNLLTARKSFLEARQQRKISQKLSVDQEMNLGKMDDAVQKIQKEIENVRAANNDIEMLKGTSRSKANIGSRDTGSGGGNPQAARAKNEPPPLSAVEVQEQKGAKASRPMKNHPLEIGEAANDNVVRPGPPSSTPIAQPLPLPYELAATGTRGRPVAVPVLIPGKTRLVDVSAVIKDGSAPRQGQGLPSAFNHKATGAVELSGEGVIGGRESMGSPPINAKQNDPRKYFKAKKSNDSGPINDLAPNKLPTEDAKSLMSRARTLNQFNRVTVAAEVKLEVGAGENLLDGIKDVKLNEPGFFRKKTQEALGANSKADVLPPVIQKSGIHQQPSGFVATSETGGINGTSWNTRQPLKGDNISHAEKQLHSFIEGQSEWWRKKITRIEINVAGRKICGKCMELIADLKKLCPNAKVFPSEWYKVKK